MAEASLKLGGGNWGVKEDSLLGYNDENGNYKPIPFDFSRASIGTRVNRDGLIETVQDNIPRIDFSDGEGSLLLEPQRTNLVTYSEQFENWTPENANVTTNATISPDGYLTADAIIEDTSNADHNRAQGILLTAASYTGSVFLKKYNTTWCAVYIYNPSGGKGIRHWINLDTLTAGTSAAIGSGITAPLMLTDYGNGWVRASITFTADASGWYLYVANAQTNGGSSSYTGDGTSGFYAWGAQLEAGSYPTSYIPTSGSAVTRVADSMTLLSMSNNITSGVSAASLFVNYEYTLNSLNDAFCFGQSNDFYPSGRGYIYNTINGFADSFGGGGFSITQGADTKTIWRLNTLSNTNIFQNGVKGPTRTGDAWSKVDQITFRGAFGTIRLKEMILFNQAITDQEAIDLTTI